jgi:hypothetical protein
MCRTTKPTNNGSSQDGHVSVADRQGVLLKLCTKFNEHLRTVPGVYLSTQVRLGIAQCAQAALTCDQCSELPRDACLRPGANFDSHCSRMHQDCPLSWSEFFPEAFCQIQPETAKMLCDIIHAIVRHQHRLDKLWYTTVLSQLEESELMQSAKDLFPGKQTPSAEQNRH